MISRKVHIIGQGLAGTVLALQLLERGVEVYIKDKGLQFGSSALAAGLWNPVGYKNLHSIWNAHALLAEMQRFYLRAESILQSNFFHPKYLLRIFPDTLSVNEWDERSVRDDLRDLIESNQRFGKLSEVHNPHGYGVVSSAGWLDVGRFLQASRAYFLANGLLEESNAADFPADQTTVWCTGVASLNHPLWKHSKLIPNKGELLTLQMNLQGPDVIYSFGRFLFRRTDGLWKYGASYSHLDSVAAPTAQMRSELVQDLRDFTTCEFEVADHQFGFRPTTPDRRPLIGVHPEYPSNMLFNGLGSRGVMLAPWCAAQIVSYLLDNKPIQRELDWTRFRRNESNSRAAD